MRSIALAAVLVVPLSLAACGDDGAGPESRRAESIAFADANITIDDGDTLQVSPNVYDQNDSLFASIPGDLDLTWSSTNTLIVDVEQDGRLIGVAPGTAQVRVEAAGGFFAVANVLVAQVPSTVTVVNGTGQSALPNALLHDSISVRVTDRHGSAVPSAAVHFRVVTGGGTIGPDTVRTTNSGGYARAGWTLGPEFASQQIEVEVPGRVAAVAVGADIAPVVVGRVDMPETATAGGTLAGALRLDSDLFTSAIGAAHVILTWDPALLQLQPVSLTNGDYGLAERRLDNAAGELHVVSTDPDATLGDLLLTGLVFDVIGAAGNTATIGLDIQQLVRVNFQVASSAGYAVDAQVSIN